MSTPGDVTISKTQRWLDLIAFLVKRRFPVPVDELMQGVPAYRDKYASDSEKDRAALHRMFERDKDELRAAGIPIETVEYSISQGTEQSVGYRLSAKDFYLPYLRLVGGEGEEGKDPATRARAPSGVSGLSRPLDLRPEDFHTALDALRRVQDLPGSPFADEARSAITKLTFDVGPGDVPQTPVLFAESEEADAVRDTLRTLTDALRTRSRVRFRYHGIHRGTPTDRDVAPHGLLYQGSYWYLIGPDATRDGAVRVFRLGRMEAVEVGPQYEYEYDPEFELEAYTGRQPWELGDDDPLAADVLFEFPLALWAERNRHGERVEERAGGAVVRRFSVRQADPFLRWLQGFAGDATVVAPPELREAQVELARRTLEVYAD